MAMSCWCCVAVAMGQPRAVAPLELPRVAPGEVLVKFKPAVRGRARDGGVELASVQSLVAALPGGQIERAFASQRAGVQRSARMKAAASGQGLDLWYRLRFDPAVSVGSVLARLLADPAVAAAEPRRLRYAAALPNDPLVPFFFNAALGRAEYQWNLDLVQAQEAWALSQGDTNVVIAIVDDGVQWTHPDLLPNLAYNRADPIDGIDNDGNGYVDDFRGWDFAGASRLNFVPDNDPQPADSARYATFELIAGNPSFRWGRDYQYYHGTVVAGYAAAATDNSVGGASTGWRCRFLPIKVAPDTARLDSFLFAPLYFPYEGVAYAAERGADIINCSFGGTDSSQAEHDVVKYATALGSLVVAAAGNSNSDTAFYPAAYPEVLSVASSDTADRKTPNSTYHATVDVTAPGRGPVVLPYPWGVYTMGWISGIGWATSWASAQAAAVAALTKAHVPTLTNAELHARLTATADPIDALNPAFAGRLGAGRVNAHRALVGVPTSLEPDAEASSGVVRAYPNPTRGQVWVQAPSGAVLALYDGLGCLLSQATAGEQPVSLALPGPGLYLLRASVGGRAWTLKVIGQ